jgi:hypothetical protein
MKKENFFFWMQPECDSRRKRSTPPPRRVPQISRVSIKNPVHVCFLEDFS